MMLQLLGWLLRKRLTRRAKRMVKKKRLKRRVERQVRRKIQVKSEASDQIVLMWGALTVCPFVFFRPSVAICNIGFFLSPDRFGC
mmetsp:Transcript_111122/g.203579  ORF Transcript_111122/g.203579 Transcript_111122/m.203579 type:complete len:85 (-) Transcript_111122:49-303(-)